MCRYAKSNIINHIQWLFALKRCQKKFWLQIIAFLFMIKVQTWTYSLTNIIVFLKPTYLNSDNRVERPSGLQTPRSINSKIEINNSNKEFQKKLYFNANNIFAVLKSVSSSESDGVLDMNSRLLVFPILSIYETIKQNTKIV